MIARHWTVWCALAMVLAVTLAAVGVAQEQDADIAKANSYDDAWQDGPDGWVANCTQMYLDWLMAGEGSDGFIVRLGDSITYSNPSGQWARGGSGKTAEDERICSWMHSYDWGNGSNSSVDGWYLSAYDVPGYRSYTAESGIRTDQYLYGLYDLPSTDEMYTVGFTNPDGKQYRDAQIAVVMLGTNDASANRSTAAMIADLEAIIDKVLANNTIVCLITLPPKWNDQTDVQNYNAAIRSLAQTRRLPLIDYYEEVLRRRPGTSWYTTLISSDGVHPTASQGGYTATSDPYANDGIALSNSGHLLYCWATVQKIREIKDAVVGPAPRLIASDPANDGTLCKDKNNVMRLYFDKPLTIAPWTVLLQVEPLAGGSDIGIYFWYFGETTTLPNDTLMVKEQMGVLNNQTWYRITPRTAFVVEPFELTVCTLLGDANGDGTVMALDLGAVWAHNGDTGDARYDINGDGTVMALDLGMAWAENGTTLPAKP